jgi:glyoxylase-like metal-dependent hydrolase (beta-lactamase superfamily II)
MPNYICITCGTQYPATDAPPEHCPICEDDRQYVNPDGQQWTTLEALRADHHNVIAEREPGLYGILTAPKVAIGERALLVQSPSGNVLWDCISYIDDAAVDAVNQLGGISAIAISHPHFYSTMGEWSRMFGGVPIYLHESNRPWVMKPDRAIVYWNEETHPLGDGLTLIRCGGHFPGSTVLHWAAGAGGKGAILTGDTIYVVADQRYVTFMYSYPNSIPLPASAIRKIAASVEPFAFDRIYAGWDDRICMTDGKTAVQRSAERYIRMIQG